MTLAQGFRVSDMMLKTLPEVSQADVPSLASCL